MKIITLFTLLSIACLASCGQTENSGNIIKQLDTTLKTNILDVWYPKTVDNKNGGFYSDYNYRWKKEGQQLKMLVTQTRHLWTLSKAAKFYEDDQYRELADHGYHFLKTKMWDKTHGGFYMFRNPKGESLGKGADNKTAYGNAFAIYALSAYYTITKDKSALDLAVQTFQWLEEHSHDPVHGGYMDKMKQDGTWFTLEEAAAHHHRLDGAGWKDQNSSIHLLEAFTDLYHIWPDALLRERLIELFHIIRDTLIGEKGYLTLFTERDWTPVTYRHASDSLRHALHYFDHVSFGHDVETAYLLLEAAHVLGIEDDPQTIQTTKLLVDLALEKGWDAKNGGFFEAGYYLDKTSDVITIEKNAKVWWAQAEGLNALLLMSTLYPEEKKYRELFHQQWNYIDQYLIDHKHGEWYSAGLDQSPEQKKRPKASIWKINYHNSRALMNCIKTLMSESHK